MVWCLVKHRDNFTYFTLLGKNASDTCAVLSEDYGGEAMKKSSVSEGHENEKKAWTLAQQLDFPPWRRTTHKGLYVKQFLAQRSITEMQHPPYSPALSPYDFWLFVKIKSALKRRRFQDIKNIRKNVTTALKATPQQELQKCFQQWLRA